MKTITIEGAVRKELGKKATKAVRNQGHVPGVIYGGENVVHFSAPTRDFRPAVYTPDFQKVDIVLDGQTYSTIIKDLQFHPVKDTLLHMDFQQLVPGKKVIAEVPIRLEGLATGVKAGGKLMTKMRKIKIKTDPENLKAEIKVDVSDLELGKSVRVKDIDYPDAEFLSSPATPIASVEITRALRAAQAAAAKDA